MRVGDSQTDTQQERKTHNIQRKRKTRQRHTDRGRQPAREKETEKNDKDNRAFITNQQECYLQLKLFISPIQPIVLPHVTTRRGRAAHFVTVLELCCSMQIE